MNVKVIAATSNIDSNGNRLSKAQLKDLAKTAIGQRIGVNFNPFIPPVGSVTNAKVEDGKLLIEAEILDNQFEGYFIAPSYKIDKNTRVIEASDFALTREHSDEGATAIEGRKKPEPCYLCGKPSVALCDYVLEYGLEDPTCDRPLCGEHARKPYPDQDIVYCPEHWEVIQRLKDNGEL